MPVTSNPALFQAVLGGLVFLTFFAIFLSWRLAKNNSHPGPSDFSLIKKMWGLTLPANRLAFANVLLLQLAYSPLALLQPIPLTILADQVIGGRPFPAWISSLLPVNMQPESLALTILICFTLLVAVVSQIHNIVAWMSVVRMEEKVVYEFRAKLFAKAVLIPVKLLEEIGTKDILFRISQDSDSAKQLTVGLTRYLVSIVTLVVFGIVMFMINPLMSVIALLPAPIAFIVFILTKGRIRHSWEKAYVFANHAFNTISESLYLSRIVRAFGRADWHTNQFNLQSKEAIQQTIRASRTEATGDACLGIIFAVGHVLIFYVGVLSIQANELTLGELLVFHAYTGQMYNPLAMLSRMTGDLQQHLAMADRAFSVFDNPSERATPISQPVTRPVQGCIELQSVSYAYPSNPKLLVIKELSFTVPAGSMVGITGPSGSGKSTLLDLVLGFSEPVSGKILLDGSDLRNFGLAELRQHYALITQDPVLFSDTIEENVKYGRRDASYEEVLLALEHAGAKEMLRDMPRGLLTQVGERGAALSGGQRQRVAIARALLKNSPVLVMDEPTSALDSATETEVIQAIQAIRNSGPRKTIIVVTHSKALLDICESVYQL